MSDRDLLLGLKGKTITDVHIGADGTGQPVHVTLWFDDCPPILFASDDNGLVVSVDTLDDPHVLTSPDKCPQCDRPLTFDLRTGGGWRCPVDGPVLGTGESDI